MINETKRAPLAAGKFYPADPAELTRTLSALFSNKTDREKLTRAPLVTLAPHSALDKSGKVAAAAFSHLLGQSYDVVVVIAPTHGGHFPGASVFDGASYVTPLGEIHIDHSVVSDLTELSSTVFASSRGHTGADSSEFTIEMALPFLQIALGTFPMVAIVIGDQEIPTARALADALHSALKKRNPLIVVSSDLSHYHDKAEATTLDQLTLQTLKDSDPERLINLFVANRVEACGMIGLIAGLLFARRIGIDEIHESLYQQSDVGDGEVIGHAALVMTRAKKRVGYEAHLAHKPSMSEKGLLTDEERDIILKVARKAVLAKISDWKFAVPSVDSRSLNRQRGVFVSVYKDGAMVGRVGLLRSRKIVLESVAEVACSAFFDSSDIPKEITAEELDSYTFKVAILSSLERISSPDEFKPAEHGALVKIDNNSAYMLPDEFTAGVNAKEALEQVCLKATLPKNTFENPQAEVYRFAVEDV
ncbi:AmmeMemoRadiSam system protein B [bacterium AH-315-F03]|nr:AmmeMemoRadiSam system protein B [bacterium AH-315-F03]